MPFVTQKSIVVLGGLSLLAVALAAAFVWSGIYDVGADDPHTQSMWHWKPCAIGRLRLGREI
jgi:hypothetical protein